MPPSPERRAVFLVGAVQFVNILDFIMVAPLGPDFARALAIPLSRMGLVTSAYSAAAAIAGLLGSFFLDRYGRRAALATAALGLGIATAAAGFSTGLPVLLAARVLAGVFGGPATSIAFSIIADVVPAERRGRAIGAVAGALSVAQVVGVPLGLQLSLWGGWRLPFLAVGAMGGLMSLGALVLLPPLRDHLGATAGTTPGRAASLGRLLSRPLVLLSYLMTAVVMAAGFLVLPNIPAWLQHNLHYPRARFQYLYAAGGVATFVTNRLFGRAVDRLGSFRIGLGAAALLLVITWFYLIAPPPGMPVLLVFVAFAVTLGARNVAYNSLTTQVPLPGERARFLSLQSTVYHLASSLGAAASARLLGERTDHSLAGMSRVALVSMALTAAFPPIVLLVERGVRRAAKATAGAA